MLKIVNEMQMHDLDENAKDKYLKMIYLNEKRTNQNWKQQHQILVADLRNKVT